MSVKFELNDGVAIITIDRPQARNAIDGATALAMSEMMQRLNSDRSIRVGVLTGACGHFCAGMDLKAFLRGEVTRLPEVGFAGVTQARIAKPLIAAIEGYALAGGFEIALACDMVIAAEDAKFGLSEVKRGLVANAGGLVRLPRQLPMKIASELVLTGEIVPASLLAHHGLINHVVPSGKALEAAIDYARKIAANGPLAVAVSKQVLNESQDWLSTEMFDRQYLLTAPVFKSSDAREGAGAFAEKRTPIWRGE
jgi:enoyl-CoA hydratase